MIINCHTTNEGIPKKYVPKFLIYLFLSFCLFGFDFGFTELIRNTTYRFMIKIVKISLVIAHSLILAAAAFDVANDSFFWYLCNFMHYLMCFLVISATKYNLFRFLKDCYDLDSKSVLTRKDNILILVFVYIVLVYGMKLFSLFLECAYWESLSECKLGGVSLYLYLLPLVSLDLIPLVLIMLNYYIYSFLTCLIEAYYKSEIHFDLLENNFMAIAEIFDKMKPVYGNLVSTYVFFKIYSWR